MSAKSTHQKNADSIDNSQGSTLSESATGKKQSLSEYNKNAPFSFNAKNYKLLLIGLGVNILGFILMIGGAAENLDDFNADELFSHRRITIAPMLIVLGYIIIMYSIMKRPKSSSK